MVRVWLSENVCANPGMHPYVADLSGLFMHGLSFSRLIVADSPMAQRQMVAQRGRFSGPFVQELLQPLQADAQQISAGSKGNAYILIRAWTKGGSRGYCNLLFLKEQI